MSRETLVLKMALKLAKLGAKSHDPDTRELSEDLLTIIKLREKYILREKS